MVNLLLSILLKGWMTTVWLCTLGLCSVSDCSSDSWTTGAAETILDLYFSYRSFSFSSSLLRTDDVTLSLGTAEIMRVRNWNYTWLGWYSMF